MWRSVAAASFLGVAGHHIVARVAARIRALSLRKLSHIELSDIFRQKAPILQNAIRDFISSTSPSNENRK